jgi:hypothetical protein
MTLALNIAAVQTTKFITYMPFAQWYEEIPEI